MSAPAIVVDTNVFVAAGFRPQSASAKLLEAVERGRLRMVWNEATRREIERIIGRIPPLRNEAISELFRPEDRFSAPTDPDSFAAVPDPEDRKFAALAEAADAVLISNDEHLLGARDELDIMVLPPSAFWKRLQEAAQEQ